MSQGLISNFRNISIKKNKNKSITSIKSIPSFHNQSPQTIFSSTHNTLNFFQIHHLKSTLSTKQSLNEIARILLFFLNERETNIQSILKG